jgi:transcription termination/antitermination protein NusA
VREDQLSLAIGKRGQNVRLAARLTGWDLDIMLSTEFTEQRTNAVAVLAEVPGVEQALAERIAASGFVSFRDIAELEPQALMRFEGMTEEVAQNIIAFSGEYLKQLEAAKAQEKAEPAAVVAEGETTEAPEETTEQTTEQTAEETTQESTEESMGEVTEATAGADVQPAAADQAAEPTGGSPGTAEVDGERAE